ncbi:MAG: amino acid adenylation domain-containing protein, partial [Acidobacteria bacterium]|nr:amino acid adenylation domain-containing protein [Acidobacteriota bacterium]
MKELTTPLSDVLSIQSSMQRRLVSPLSSFVRFQKEWTERSVLDCFGDRTKLHVDRVAIRTANRELTYRELELISNGVAAAILSLRNTGAEPIPLLLEHEAAVPAAILGVLKAGKFYVPLDPTYPHERNHNVLEDSQAELIITNARNLSLARSLSGSRRQLVNLDEISPLNSNECPKVATQGDDLAYVLYTSGSTGKPKGVMHTHRNLLHNVMRHTNGRQICADDRIALLFSYSFGASVTNTFGAMLNGATLLPFDLKELGVARLAEWLEHNEITMFHTVPTVFRHLTDTFAGHQTFPKLRLIRLGGETMYQKDVERFKKHFSDDCILHVGMGSGETGVVLECFFDKRSDCKTHLAPAGYAAEDTEVLILDEKGDAVEFEHVGQIAIRSGFLSVGYWRRPELTKAAFLPYPEGGNERIYLTGDLGYMLPDGCVFHVGRQDSQVKIRGHRVELGEIEAALLNINGVKEAVVLAREDRPGKKRLVAYVAPDGHSTLRAPLLQGVIRKKLPDYMVPSAFVVLDSLPLLPNGKVDRQALLECPDMTPPSDKPEVAPRDFLEGRLCLVWKELLGLPSVGIHDDFFDLGGDSLLAVQMLSEIEEIWGQKLSVFQLLNGITVERLSKALMEEDRENFKTALVAIHPQGSRRPFFFLHGDAQNGGFYCRNLARHLGEDQPFCAVMPHGFDGCPIPESIEAMAADRLQAILTVQPAGPYFLGGFCNGGVIAFEIARQLQQRNEKVEALLLIDARERNASLRFASKALSFLALLLGLRPDTRRKCFRRLRSFFIGVQGRLRIFFTGLREASREGSWATIHFLLKKPRSLAIEFLDILDRLFNRIQSDSSTSTPALVDEQAARVNALHQAIEDYVPGKYFGRILLFRSSSHLTQFPGDPVAGWRGVTSGVEVYSLRGDHHGCLTTDVA